MLLRAQGRDENAPTGSPPGHGKDTPLRLTLRTFGPPELAIDGASPPPELTWRKHLGLLLYLARSPGGRRRRDHLVGLLWPDKDEAKARHSLNEACRAVRRALGDDALDTQGDRVALDLGLVDADWAAMDRALEANDAAAVAALWRGDFLEGLGIPDATPFEDWLAAERAGWRRRVRDTLVAAATRASAEGRHAEATRWAERVLLAEPLAEGALRVAMIADALSGAAPAALARYAQYAERLAREERAVPAGDLAELAERIRAGQRRAERGDVTAEQLPPLVGRERALAALGPYLPARSGRCAVVLVTGAAGAGKTRLLHEAAERARLEGGGARLVRVTCVGADGDAPGSVLAALLARGLAQATGLAGAAPESLAALAAIAPEVARRYPGAQARPAAGAAEMGHAFGEALTAIAGDGPVALALDDAHLADELSLEALPALLRAAQAAPVLLLLSARMDAGPPAALLELRARVGHDVPGVEVAVPPLEDAEVDALAARMLTAYGEEARGRLVRRLRGEAGGVPLFVVEILRALAKGGTGPTAWPPPGATTAQPLPFPIPGAAAAALTLRAQSLATPVREALGAAAVAGTRPEPAVVAAILETSVEEAERRLDALARAGFLREEDGVYVFTAELVRGYVESELLASTDRRRSHRRAAGALAAAGRGESFAFAEHLYGAGAWREAADVAGAAASAATAQGGRGRLAERARRLAARARERLQAAER